MTNEFMKKKYIRQILILLVSASLLLVMLLISIFTGSVSYTINEIITAFLSGGDPKVRDIIISIRLPRVLIAALVGMNLAVAGTYMQAVMRNPMADPGIIGVSTGSGFAAVLVMLVFPGITNILPIVSFLGGCIACILVFTLSWKNGTDPVRLILSGVAVNALLGGGISLLSLLYSDRIQGILLWVNGSLSAKSLSDFFHLLPFTVTGLILSVVCIPFANVLILGDDVAKSLGIPVNTARICLSAAAAYLTGISISTVGLIGFIGLIIPHVARLLAGSDYKILIPLSAMLGALLLICADCIARTVFSPTEIPVGVVMSIIGGPFFIWLLRRGKRL